MAPADPILFAPHPSAIPAILADALSPTLSLSDVAARHHTTPEALALWMSTPDIRTRIETLDRAATWRTRLCANAQLLPAIGALLKVLNDFTNLRSQSESNSNSKSDLESESDSDSDRAPNSYRSLLLNLRRAETTRKAAALLVQLTRARPVPGPELLPVSDSRATDRGSERSVRFDVPIQDPRATTSIPVPRIAGTPIGGLIAPQPLDHPSPSCTNQAPRFVPPSTVDPTIPAHPPRVGGPDSRPTSDELPTAPDNTSPTHPSADSWHGSTPAPTPRVSESKIQDPKSKIDSEPPTSALPPPTSIDELLANLLPHLETLAKELGIPTEDLGPQDLGPNSPALVEAGVHEHWP